jgi:hypothetical protein
MSGYALTLDKLLSSGSILVYVQSIYAKGVKIMASKVCPKCKKPMDKCTCGKKPSMGKGKPPFGGKKK